jgi:VCBS repeat-containing protein
MAYAYNTFDAWLEAQGFSSYLNSDGELKDGTSQSFFSSQYSAWLNALIAFYGNAIRARYGLPPDTQLLVAFDSSEPSALPTISGLTQGQVDELFDDASDFTWTSGKTTKPIVHERDYSNSFNFGLFDNVAPIADAVFASGNEDATFIAVTLTGSDPDQGGAVMSFTLASLPSADEGVLYIDPAFSAVVLADVAYAADGQSLTLYLVPAPNFNGSIQFSYTVSDGDLSSSAATATVTVAQINDPASFGGQTSGSGQEDGGPIIGTLMASDDADGMMAPNFRIESGNGPSNGAALIDALSGEWSYTPNADYNGVDHFTVSVSDDDGNVETKTLSVTISPIQDPPDALDDVFVVSEDVVIFGNVVENDTDPDGDAVSVISLAGVSDASSVPRIVITEIMANPADVSDANGEWFEVYNASAFPVDLNGWTIHIGSNEILVSSPTPLVMTPGSFFIFAANDDPSVNGGLPYVGYETGPLGLTNAGTIIVLFDPEGNEIDQVDYSGSNFPSDVEGRSLYLVDANSDNNQGEFWKNSEFFSYGGLNYGTPGQVNPSFGGSPGGDPAAIIGQAAIFPSGARLTVNADGTFYFDPNGVFEYLPAGQSAMEQFSYTISDGQGGISLATVTLSVEGVNDAPISVDDSFGTMEDVSLVAGSVLINDIDVDLVTILTANLIDGPSHGSLTLNTNGTFSYVPNTDFNGADVFTYVANDGYSDSGVATVVIQVAPANDEPVARDDMLTANTGTPLLGNVLANDTDPDGDTLTVVAIAGVTPGDATPKIVITEIMANPADVSDTNGEWFEVYNASAFPVDLNGWTIRIGSNEMLVSRPVPLVVTSGGFFVFAANDDPSANGGLPNVGYETGPLGLTNAGTSIVLVDPEGNEIDQVDYSGGNFPPDVEGRSLYLVDAASDNSQGEFWKNTEFISYGGLNYGTPGQVNPQFGGGVDPNAPQVGEQVTLASGAVLTLNADGSFAYETNGAFDDLAMGETATDGFSYTVSDGNGGVDTAVASIEIIGVRPANHAPIAVDDFAIVFLDSEVEAPAPGVLANDFDVDGDPFELVAIDGDEAGVGGTFNSLPSGAHIQVFSDGAYDYLPDAPAFFHLALGESYIDTITYTIRDVRGMSSDGHLIVTVNGLYPGPIARDDFDATNEDSLLFGNVSVLANDEDFDGSTALTIAAVNGSEDAVGHQMVLASGALLRVLSDGNYIYNPNGRFESLQSGEFVLDAFEYTIANSYSVWATATVTITINGVDDAPPDPSDPHAPVAGDDFAQVFVDTEVNALPEGPFALLRNDFDPDGDGFELVAINGDVSQVDTGAFIALPSGALFQVFSDGAYDYVADSAAFSNLAAGESFVDHVTYTIRDTTGLTSDGTLEVTVIAPNNLHATLDYAVLEFPASLAIEAGGTAQVYGQVFESGLTELFGPSANVFGQLGVGAVGTDPQTSTSWTWIDATYDSQVAANDEYVAVIPDGLAPGEYAYAYRFGVSSDGQPPTSWTYADLDGSSNGFGIGQLGELLVL